MEAATHWTRQTADGWTILEDTGRRWNLQKNGKQDFAAAVLLAECERCGATVERPLRSLRESVCACRRASMIVRNDVCDDNDENATPAMLEARAAIARIERALAAEAAHEMASAERLRLLGRHADAEELMQLADSLVARIDAETPADDDWFFRLVRIAYPGEMSLERIAKFMEWSRPLRAVGSKKKTQRTGREAKPLTRERVRQIEASGLRKLDALRKHGTAGDKAKALDLQEMLHDRDRTRRCV